MAPKGPAHPERSFGLSVGGFASVVAVYLWWRGSTQAASILGVLGAGLFVFGLLLPRALYWPSRGWWRLAHVLGYINARIILTILFTALLVPIGLLWRIIGKDPLSRRRDRWPGWSPYPARYRDPKHYSRMY